MTKPTTITSSKLSIWLGDGASPEVFAAPCGLTTRGISFSASANDVSVPDCDDPDAPAWTERAVEALSAGVNGSGVLAMEALPIWQAYFFGAVSKNCRIVLDHDDAGRFDGRFICSGLNITGELGNKVQVELSLQSDGEIEYMAGLS